MRTYTYTVTTARFLSPDPYVQSPTNSQNYNRYSYCLNNPLKYTDPSGEFFIGTIVSFVVDLVGTAFTKGGLDFTSKSSMKSAWKDFDPSASWSKTNKAWKIDKGLFVTDPNKSNGSRMWELVSRHTLQGVQSLLGHSYAAIMNICGNVKEVDYYGGATTVTRYNSSGTATLGNFIVGSNELQADPNNWLFQHEYGHYIQSQKLGPTYFTRVALPSLISAIKDTDKNSYNHDNFWVERDANKRALLYFNSNCENVIWDDFKNPIGEGYDNNKNYDDTNNLNILNNLRLRNRWYNFLFGL